MVTSHVQVEVLASLPLDDDPKVLGLFAELAGLLNQLLSDQNLWVEIVHSKKGVYFLISRLKE